MSGPVDRQDTEPVAASAVEGPPVVEVTEPREARVGTTLVRRVLPRRQRRTIGAWCFADQMGPERVTETRGLDIGPHPHIGLHTVTWLLAGAVVHRDSLGSEQLIRPGELNLMTAGHGVVHAEEHDRGYRGELHGMQLWVAQPDTTRDGAAAFEHHAELPHLEVAAAEAIVLVGTFAGVTSPARADTELVGADLTLAGGASVWPLRPDFEHGLVVLDGDVHIAERPLQAGQLGYLGAGRQELAVVAHGPARVLLLGGVPFPEPVVMWWNFVARGRDELRAARSAWEEPGEERFAAVASALPRVPAPSWL